MKKYLPVAISLCLLGCTSYPRSAPKLVSTESGLVYLTTLQGDGRAADWGDTVTIHESTARLDGTMVFSTFEINSPITFTLGADQVIDGMEEVLIGMRVGEQRSAVMPPAITKRERYPRSQSGEQPIFGPDDTLRFEIELLSIQAAEQ
jgi:FKBP-type peptidyl-prolyl cis-trans isomerase